MYNKIKGNAGSVLYLRQQINDSFGIEMLMTLIETEENRSVSIWSIYILSDNAEKVQQRYSVQECDANEAR